ncbi:MAG: hypothetical protein FWE03_04540 [Firmicutes bacterium]|nr:hypothetical protein [Bacillota bacterium]
MYEFKILRLERRRETKTREVAVKKGKTALEEYIEVEEIEDFFIRIERELNDWGNKGWQAISTNYALPIHGFEVAALGGGGGYSTTNWHEMEFVVVLQRAK